ncbi:MAG: DUF3795 domain-containing protein [Dehalococcoidia bacterium]|nr:MAG: DUF3795 domain-containing protein [Dehalococcoidia bacterium]
MRARICRFCLNHHGSNPLCKIKSCCQKKGYETCAECDQFEPAMNWNFWRPTTKMSTQRI